jgi:PTH1 family peptidyl-tRNA hydrolase
LYTELQVPELYSSTFLIAGLGNPGRKYRQTRHNIGFMLLDRLAEQFKVSFTRFESKSLVTKVDYSDRKLVLAKPQTYMNLSGQAIGSLLKFYKIPINNFMVVYDEVDLPFGALRIRSGGGSAGHKGMVSIIERLQSEGFPRIRIGIGRPPGKMEAATYVLQEFHRDEREILDMILDRAAQAVKDFISQGIDFSMNKYNAC